MKKIVQTLKYLSVFILALSVASCEDDDVVLPSVEAGFTFTLNMDTGTVTFINLSENANNYEWSFGDGTSSTEINPIKVYENGTYTVVLESKNVSGASDTFEDEITILIPEIVSLPISFDGTNTNYDATTFGGAVFTVVDNPAPGGSNASASKVGAITNIGAAFEGIYFDLGAPINLTIDKSISVSFWSETPVGVLLKLEEGTAAATEATASHTGSGWEELIFTFSSAAQYNRFTLFVDGPGTSSGTFYVDNITQIPTVINIGGTGSIMACAGGELINDFESADDAIFNNFGGGVGTIIDNTNTTINPSTKLGQYVKNSGEVFGGITISLANNIDFNAGVFSIDVLSQSQRQLLFKLEGLGIELTMPTSGTGWETIQYDFSSSAGNMGDVTAITLIMDNGTMGDGSSDWTIQYDNIRLCGNGSTGSNLLACAGGELINDFESANNAIFNNFGGGVATVETNTDTSVNTSTKIGKYVKNTGEVFGGTTISLASNIDFNAGSFSIDVSSTTVRQLLFKLEGLGIEVILPTSGTGWETLNYDFSSAAGNVGDVTAITLIMDNGTMGDGSADWTILFDNIRLCSNNTGGGGGSGSCPAPPSGDFISDGDFEANTGCWELIQIQAGTSSTIVSDVNNGGTNSARVETAQGGNPGIKQTRFGIGAIQPNTNYTVTFDIRADANDPVANGSILNAATFSEAAEDSGIGAVRHNLISGEANIATTWTTKTLTFTTAGNVDGGLSLLIELIGGGPTTTGTVYIDNVSLRLTP